MMLQKSPLGFLGAFALKVLGKNPDVMSDAVVPTADIYDQYLLTQELTRQGATVTLLAAATSIAGNLTVPAGKMWRVLAVGAAMTINAADAALLFDVAVAVLPPGAPAPAQFVSFRPAGTTVGRSNGLYLARPLVLPSGWSLNYTVTTSAAAPANNVPTSVNALVHEIDQ